MSAHPAAEKVYNLFDFDLVKKAIDATGAQWYFDGEYRTPTLEEIKDRAHNLLSLRMANPSELYGINDQGMVARVGGGVLSLSYIVEAKAAEIEEEPKC